MRVVRSPVAHRAAARQSIPPRRTALPGVAAVWTAADVGGDPADRFPHGAGSAAWSPYRQPVLARDKVRYVGEPVAVVFAEDA